MNTSRPRLRPPGPKITKRLPCGLGIHPVHAVRVTLTERDLARGAPLGIPRFRVSPLRKEQEEALGVSMPGSMVQGGVSFWLFWTSGFTP